MAGIWKLCILSLTLYVLLHPVQNSKLNVPRVLLPIFKEFSTNFTLEVDTGCYKWTTSRIEFVQLSLVHEEEKPRSADSPCHKKVVVSSISKETSRNTAIVFAEEINSGRVLRCDVIVDVIDHLNIVTTTRELFMEEAPEAFEVRAYDDQGNEFTTLEGIEFQWSIGSWTAQQDGTDDTVTTKISPNNVLRFITFRDSPYETPPTVDAFDKTGKQGHIVLLEGLKTGSAKVSVRLPHPEYEHVPAIEVQLMVVANLIIEPSDVYLLEDDTIQYRILKVHDGHLEEIPLPSSEYFLEMEDKEIASLIDDACVVKAIREGKTKVLLHDRNVNESETGIRAPSATLTVTPPVHLALAILPNRNWNVLVGEAYEIVVEVYDSNKHKMHLGDGAQIQVDIPPEYFSVQMSTKNNSYHFGFPTKLGRAQIHAAMNISKEGTHKIEADAEMLIFECIILNPSEIYVPWDPVLQPRYEVPVIASGGDGSFLWSSTNDTIATVTQNGLVTLQYQGEANISAAMTRNHFNYGLTQVYVLPPDHLQIIEYIMEAELGVPIFIHLALYADIPVAEETEFPRKERVPFMHCDDLPFLTKIWSENFLNSSLKTTPVGIGCGTVAVIGTALGTSKVTVSYTHESHVLEDSAVVATYKPLKVVHPVSQETVLAVGTSREIVFSGGPRPWLGKSAEHLQQIEVSGDGSVVTVKEIKEKSLDMPDTYVYNVLCRRVGDVEVKLLVSNRPLSEPAKRAEATAAVRVQCAKPRYVTLHSELEVADVGACPLNLNSERVVTQNYKDVELIVTVKDADGRPFDNISSLYFEWKLSHPYLGTIAEIGSTLAEERYDGNILLPSKYYQVVKPKGKTGVLEVSASVVAYQTHILSSLNITSESPPFSLSGSDGAEYTPDIKAVVNLILVEDTIIMPNKTQVFNHPLNTVELQVNQGSGYYEFILSAEGIADIDYVESTRILKIIPKLDGLLKLALVDLCLVSKPAVVEIEVVAVGSIRVEMPERIERDQCVQASVKLYDTSDNPLPVPRQDFLELRALPDTGIIAIRQMTDKDKEWKKASLGTEEVRFIVTGLELGETNLVFITGRDSREVRSQPLRIQVFPPLRLHPRNLSLVIGSQFQISHRGGPQPDANVEYMVLNDRILSITIVGVIRALAHGCTTVIGKVMGINKSTGNRIKYSEDRIEIRVIPLRGINIHAGVTRIKTGNTMPIWAHGIPEQLNPLIIGALRPPLIFQWSLSNREIGILHHAYDSIGLKVGEEDQVSMRFTALQPGLTTVKLSVIAPPGLLISSEGAFNDFLEIEVFEDLKLLNPASGPGCPTKTVLMAPNSAMQLKTNRDGLAHSMSYSVGGSSLFSDSEHTNMTKALAYPTDIVTVDKGGMLTAHSHLGRASVIIVAKEDSGIKQVTGITVEVKQIQYVMLTPKTSFKLIDGHNLEVLPQGADMSFLISYHDRTGSEFTTFKSELKLRTNRFDLARFRKGEDNDTLNTKLVQEGEMMLKVWDEMNPHHAADYLKINIGEIIYQKKEPLVVGDRVCFSVPLLTQEGKSGRWVSDNEAVLHIDSNLGIGRAKQPGTVSIRHVLDATYTFTEIKVLPVTKITFLELPDKVLTNTDVSSQFLVPLVLHSIDNLSKENNFVTSTGTCHIEYKAQTFPFMCELRFDNPITHLDISEVFAAFQVYDHIAGTYGCSIISAGEPSLNKSVMETNFTLYVFSGTLLSQPLHIPFAPGVFVHQKEVNLSDIRNYAHIAVSGVPDVLKEVVAESSNVMEVEIVKSEEVEPTKKLFYVKLTPYFWNEGDLSIPLSVYIISPVTHQRIKIPVRVKLATAEGWNTVPCIMGKWSNVPVSDVVYYYRHTFTVIGSIVIILTVTIYVFFNYFSPAPRSSLQPVSPVEQFKSFRINNELETMSPGRSSSLLHPQSSILTSSAMGQTIYGDPMMYYQASEMRPSVRNRRL